MLPADHTLALAHDWSGVGRPLLALLVLAFILHRIYRMIRPQEQFVWSVATYLELFQVVCDLSRVLTLGELNALFPERHCGAIVLLRVYFDWGNVHSAPGKGLAKVVWRLGISPKNLPGDLVVLGPADAAKLLGRLDDTHSVRGDYVVLPDASAEEAERFALLKLTLKEPAARREALAKCGFFCIDGNVGPFNQQELPRIFQKWVATRLRKLYDGNQPAGVEEADFAALLRLDPAHGSHELLAQLGRQGARLWAVAAGTTEPHCIEFDRGRWTSVPAGRPPAALRPMSWWKKLVLILLLIVVVLPAVLIAAPFRPLDGWLARRRDEKLRRAREAVQ